MKLKDKKRLAELKAIDQKTISELMLNRMDIAAMHRLITATEKIIEDLQQFRAGYDTELLNLQANFD